MKEFCLLNGGAASTTFRKSVRFCYYCLHFKLYAQLAARLRAMLGCPSFLR